MSFKQITFIFVLALSFVSRGEAAVALPDGRGTYTIFQEDWIFFACTERDLKDPLVNPLLCGNRRIEKRNIETVNFERKLFQEFPNAKRVKDLSAKKDDYNSMTVLTHQKDHQLIQALEQVAANVDTIFVCEGQDCPQFFNDWKLIKVSKDNSEMWKHVKSGLIWADANFHSFTYQQASQFCASQQLRLPTVLEAEMALKAKLMDHTNCGKFADLCSSRWFWSSSATPYGEHWVYPLSNGNFMKLLGMDNTGASVRCVGDAI